MCVIQLIRIDDRMNAIDMMYRLCSIYPQRDLKEERMRNGCNLIAMERRRYPKYPSFILYDTTLGYRRGLVTSMLHCRRSHVACCKVDGAMLASSMIGTTYIRQPS